MSGGRRKKKRIRQGVKIKSQWGRKLGENDDMAMFAANIGSDNWRTLPEYTKQLYRLRARDAMSVIYEEGKSE